MFSRFVPSEATNALPPGAGAMTARLRFVVSGRPAVKERARQGASGRFYTPTRTRAWEEWIAWSFRIAYPGHVPWTGCVGLEVEVLVEGRGSRCHIRGDGSNYLKACEDALNTLAYRDDIQVVEARVVKRRIGRDESLGLIITLWRIEE